MDDGNKVNLEKKNENCGSVNENYFIWGPLISTEKQRLSEINTKVPHFVKLTSGRNVFFLVPNQRKTRGRSGINLHVSRPDAYQ